MNITINQPTGIYRQGQSPSHGVYRTDALEMWGERATAVSHHWSADDARAAAEDGEIVIEFKREATQ